MKTHPVSNKATKDAGPPVERVPDEGAERDLALRVPDRRQDR